MYVTLFNFVFLFFFRLTLCFQVELNNNSIDVVLHVISSGRKKLKKLQIDSMQPDLLN